jgi:hypothetical protein
LACSLLFASTASAVTDEERNGARAAATQGADAFNQNRWSDAVELFTRAEELVHSPVHLLFLGRAELKLGHWVKAYEAFNKAKRDKLPDGAPEALVQAVTDASKELAALEPQIPTVSATVSQAPQGQEVTVTMDGEKVPSALVGLARPVDPGAHQFQAVAAGAASDVIAVTVKAGDHQAVELLLKPGAPGSLPAAGAAPLPAQPAAASSPEPGPPAPAPAPSSAAAGGNSGMRIGGFVALGVGVVGAVVGTVFLVSGSGKQSDADTAYKNCGGPLCPLASRDHVHSLDSDAASAKTLGVVGLVVGGVGLATGATLLVLSGRHTSETQASVQPWIGYRSAGVSGSF